MRRPESIRKGDEGSTLVMVVFVTLFLTTILVALVAGTLNLSALSARTDKDRAMNTLLNGAIEDYLYRMNNPAPGAYIKYANTIQPGCVPGQTGPLIDTTNPLMSGMAALPGEGTIATRGVVGYTVDQSRLCAQGRIDVTVRAAIGSTTKKMVYTIKRASFLDYVYFTDYETLNPDEYDPATPNLAALRDLCARHFYEPTASGAPAPRPETGLGQNPGCPSISWMTNDFVDGSVHSNDAFMVCGTPQFTSKVTTGWPGVNGKRYLDNTDPACLNAPEFWANRDNDYCGKANTPCQGPIFTMPTDTTALGTVPGSCVYYGPTAIDFTAPNRYTVTSPFTTPVDGCGGGATPVTLGYPPAKLIYVRNVPVSMRAPLVPCTVPANGTRAQNQLGYPVMNAAGTMQDITAYGCYDGDVFVQGSFDGALTVASENRMIIRQSLGKEPLSALGLIGNKGVEIYHPVTSDGQNLPEVVPVQWVGAALLAVDDSISVQNFDKGAHLGALYVQGSFAQKWRGGMGTTDRQHGYYKHWRYDPVFNTVAPPYFLTPTNGTYLVEKKRRVY